MFVAALKHRKYFLIHFSITGYEADSLSFSLVDNIFPIAILLSRIAGRHHKLCLPLDASPNIGHLPLDVVASV